MKPIKQYSHPDKERMNNPHIGLVNESTDVEYGQNKKTYQYDPHLDPQLVWAGKAERTSFEVPTVSLHVHERIDPKTIIDVVKKEDNSGAGQQLSLFEQEKKPLREAIEFYKHREGWTNRLIAGDSLLVMNSLLEKEGMAGKVQMVYLDPPYGIKYGSNFQPFVNKRDVVDGNDEDLTQEPEMIKAFRDTWELGIHSFLSYIRDRLKLAKALLNESGSIFIQISDENVHYIRGIIEEVFGRENFVAQINFQTTSHFPTKTIGTLGDYLIWYAKDIQNIKVRKLYEYKPPVLGDGNSKWLLFNDGTYRGVNADERRNQKIPEDAIPYTPKDIKSQGASSKPQPFEFEGRIYNPGPNHHWKANYPDGMERIRNAKRIHVAKNSIQYRRFHDDFPYQEIGNFWTDTITGSFTEQKIYAVQTNTKVITRCILLSSDPGDLVLDPTCGSGTTAFVAEQWGRRWITCDTSRVATTLAKQRLITANFDYYKIARADEGLSGGFDYNIVPRITLRSIANNEPPEEITLYDQPKIIRSITRVTGPFTVESIPAPFVKDLNEAISDQINGDLSVTRFGETLRQEQWRDELLRTGVRGKGGAVIEFSRIEAQEGTKYIQALAETKEGNPKKVLVVFGPEHAPLEGRLVGLAMDEARLLKPDILLFCAFQFEEEAAKDIDETPEKLVGFKLLKAHMNMDLQTEDLKKKRRSNQSFWLIGQPDVKLHEVQEGDDKGKFQVEVVGFDYYNPGTGKIQSEGSKKIAMWMLDPDYDGRSIFPRQIFFPMAGANEGWSKLVKSLKAEVDEEKIEAYKGTVSLPFKPGKQVAVKIIDDRGIESLKILSI